MAFVLGKTNKEGALVVEGALTVSRVADVRDELLNALQTVEKVSLDLRAVNEIDLSVLQLICSAHKTAVKMEKMFELIDSSTGVAKNTAGLNGFLRQQGCSVDKDKTCLWKVKR